MDRERLERLEIEETELDAIEDALEEKQNDLETRMDTAESNGNMERKKQLEVELAEVVELMKQVKEEKKAAASKPKEQPVEKEEKTRGAVPTMVEETAKRAVPTAIDEKQEFADNVTGKLAAVTGILGGKKREKAEEAKAKSQEKAEEKAKEAEDKRHEAELKEKAAKLRKKATEEEAAKAKAEKEAAKAEEKKAEKAEKDESDANPEAGLSEYEKLLNEGIAAYATGKYNDAFQKIFKVANAGKKSKLSKEKLGQAEQLLGRMYKNGDGTTADESRAWFWFEKAADHENVEGCLALGQHNAELNPKSPTEENTFRENALKYFKIAGNNGSKVGKEKFIDICIKKKNLISFGDVRTACKFLDDLIDLESDSFVKQRLAEKKKELTDRPITKKEKKPKRRNSSDMYKDYKDALTILGAILTTFGVMLFCNYMLEYQDTFLNFNKVIPAYFKDNQPPVVWGEEILQEFGRPYGCNTGLWAMLFVPVGFFLSALYYAEKRGTIANIASEFALCFSAGATFVAFYNYYYYICQIPYGASEVLGMAIAAAVIVVMVQIPRVPGMIIRYFID